MTVPLHAIGRRAKDLVVEALSDTDISWYVVKAVYDGTNVPLRVLGNEFIHQVYLDQW